MAKYVVSWRFRLGGTAQENHEDTKRLLDTFAKWAPPSDQDFQQFLGRIDGQGGFAVVETDNPASLGQGPGIFGPWLEYEVVPVLDIMDSVGITTAGSEFRESV